MYAFTPASKIISRHKDIFLNENVLFAGNVQDLFPILLNKKVRIHTAWYHHVQELQKILCSTSTIQFGSFIDSSIIDNSNTLIYSWPRNKEEALFQLKNLLSILPINTKIFIVGENHNGVRSVEQMISEWCPIYKIDSACRCGLYLGHIRKHPSFHPEHYWQEYFVEGVAVRTLPGVFGRNKIDDGSKLLISTFSKTIKGNIADIACGTGILSSFLSKITNNITLTLSDSYGPAIEASRATLIANKIPATVVAGDIYSSINGSFDMIISNPPFHNGRYTTYKTAENIISNAHIYLRIGGELRIVAHSSLPYSNLLNNVFGRYKILARNKSFTVYQVINTII